MIDRLDNKCRCCNIKAVRLYSVNKDSIHKLYCRKCVNDKRDKHWGLQNDYNVKGESV